MPRFLQSTKLSNILTELHHLRFLRSIIPQHLTINQYTILTTSKPEPKLPEL